MHKLRFSPYGELVWCTLKCVQILVLVSHHSFNYKRNKCDVSVLELPYCPATCCVPYDACDSLLNILIPKQQFHDNSRMTLSDCKTRFLEHTHVYVVGVSVSLMYILWVCGMRKWMHLWPYLCAQIPRHWDVFYNSPPILSIQIFSVNWRFSFV